MRRWLTPFGEFRSGVVIPECPVLGWAASGGMALTGDPDGPPVGSAAGIWPIVQAVASQIKELTAIVGSAVDVNPAVALTGRAALAGLSRQGQVSVAGSTRLLACSDGWCAVTLSRDADVELVPAILEADGVGEPWSSLASMAAARGKSEIVERIQLFGVPAAALPRRVAEGVSPWQLSRIAEARPGLRLGGAIVVDLSSLWAGPLCARILADAGARVVKVESTSRPDGARFGNRDFFDWLHAGHSSVAVDFASPAGRRQLASLIDSADVVIEASRPRALQQLGVGPGQVSHRPGRMWLSITGYGRSGPELVAFGDDAAVGGGLVGWAGARPVFCTDAVADPLTGLCAALGVLASAATGGGHLIDVSMRDVAAAFAGAPAPDHGSHEVFRSGSDWIVRCEESGAEQAILPPRRPLPAGRAASLGADTERVLAPLVGQRW